MTPKILIFGYGFIGAAFAAEARRAGYEIIATARSADKHKALTDDGLAAVDPDDGAALATAVDGAHAILVAAPPTDEGCPGFAALSTLVARAFTTWIGYLSTTGVYGDRSGGWVFEDSALSPSSVEGQRRVAAERQWLSRGAQIFRLPGLYGPGRNVIERLIDGTARNIHKPGHVFSRLHHDDCASALMASLMNPQARGVFNLCDDRPAPADEVLAHAARLTGLPLPPPIAFDDPGLGPATRRFYQDNKRVANARAKAVLGWRPLYPTYVEGLDAIYRAVQSNETQ